MKPVQPLVSSVSCLDGTSRMLWLNKRRPRTGMYEAPLCASPKTSKSLLYARHQWRTSNAPSNIVSGRWDTVGTVLMWGGAVVSYGLLVGHLVARCLGHVTQYSGICKMKVCNLFVYEDTESKDAACRGCLVDYRNARSASTVDIGAGGPESLGVLLSVTDGAESCLFHRGLWYLGTFKGCVIPSG